MWSVFAKGVASFYYPLLFIFQPQNTNEFYGCKRVFFPVTWSHFIVQTKSLIYVYNNCFFLTFEYIDCKSRFKCLVILKSKSSKFRLVFYFFIFIFSSNSLYRYELNLNELINWILFKYLNNFIKIITEIKGGEWSISLKMNELIFYYT